MEEDTKEQALDKLEAILPLIAYPDELLDDQALDDYHKDLMVDPKSFLKTVLGDNLFASKYYFQNLREPVIRDDWTGFYGAAATVNAFYNPAANTIRKSKN